MSTREPIWIREDVVFAIHQRQMQEHGGRAEVRDAGLLASALVRPQNLLAYAETAPDLADLAAAYAFGIVRNHPFADGNKRTGWVVCRTFLLLAGADIAASQAEKAELVMRLAAGEVPERELARWIRLRLTLTP